MKFREQLEELGACKQSIEWVKDKTIEEAWITCEKSNWMLWFLAKTDLDLIDPLCDMAERVLDLVPEEHKLVCSNAISAARRRANKKELKDATHDSWGAAYIARNTTSDAVGYYCPLAAHHAYWAICAAAAAAAAAYYAACTGANAAVNVASFAACAGDATATAAGYNKEQKNQCDIFRKYFTIDKVKEAFNKLVS